MGNWKLKAVMVVLVVATAFVLASCGGGPNQSSDAYLSALAVSGSVGLTPAFSYYTYDYTVTAANAAGGMYVTPTAEDAGATITVNEVTVASGSPSDSTVLNMGTTTFEIVVTAENGVNTHTYTVTVTADTMLDEFSGSNTTGRDIGDDWTVFGTGTDEMYIDSGWVNSVYADAANTQGVFATFNGTVDYSIGLRASMVFYLPPTTAMGGDPHIIGGIQINNNATTGAGYVVQVEWNTASYQLTLSEFDGSSSVSLGAGDCAPDLAAGTSYLLEIKANDTGNATPAIQANLYDASDTTTPIATADLPITTRNYTTGNVAFFNYVVDAVEAPLGYTLSLDDFTIERSSALFTSMARPKSVHKAPPR
jgi:hypothetical protein